MNSSLPLVLHGPAPSGHDPLHASPSSAKEDGDFGVLLEAEAGESPVEDESGPPPGWVPLAEALAPSSPPVVPAESPPPDTGRRPDAPAADSPVTAGPAAPSALPGNQGTAPEPAPLADAVTAPGAGALPEPPGPPRRGRRRAKDEGAGEAEPRPIAVQAAPDKRAGRVGWVKGRAGQPAHAVTVTIPRADRMDGKPSAGRALWPSRPDAADLPADLVTSLRWIADPVPPRSATPVPTVSPRPEPPPDFAPILARQTEAPAPPAGPAAPGPTSSLPPACTGETELALDMADLGPVRLRIRDRRGRLALHVLADHPATLDLLRRHADELTGALQEAGLDTASLTWGRSASPGTGSAPAGPEVSLPAAEPGASPGRSDHSDKFDLLL